MGKLQFHLESVFDFTALVEGATEVVATEDVVTEDFAAEVVATWPVVGIIELQFHLESVLDFIALVD